VREVSQLERASIGGTPSDVSDDHPDFQNKTTNDENQIRYGAQDVNDDPPPCLPFADQSGFGFDGMNSVTMPTDGSAFKLGNFTHYNGTVNIDVAYNPLTSVSLTIRLSGGVDALLKCNITLDETANDDVPCKYPDAPNDPPCGEKVALADQPLLTSIIPIQGKQYIIQMLGFSDCDSPGTPNKIFYTHEMAADKSCLYARLVALPTAP